MLRSLAFASALGLAVVVVAPSARAAGDNEGGAAAAESMFQEGRKAMDAKRYGEACPKFAASQKLAPAIGTLLNLADCYEKNNQLASAWARFHEAIALAQRLGRGNREQTARERADKLEPRLIKLTIQSHSSGIEVKLDGNTLDPAVLGTGIPVDAGKHSIEASAKNKKPFSKDIEVTEKNKSPTIDIPTLEDDQSKDAKGADTKPEKKETITEPPKEERGGWSTQKTLGLVAGGVGVVALGVGGFFGLKTQSTWKDAQGHCTSDLTCDQEGVDLAADAKSSGNIATIAIIAGSVLVLGGAVLFFTAPSHGSAKTGATPPPSSIKVGFGPGSVVVGGKF
jgi:hypothetical protein